MEKKFGEFATVEELNRAAAAQKAEGDKEALIALALENGLDEEDAEDYYDNMCDELCTQKMAALAKLGLEERELDLKSQLKDWKDMVAMMAVESRTDTLAEAIFRPEKKLLDVLAKGLKKASDNRITVDSRIIKAAGLSANAAQIGMVGREEMAKIIEDYYLGGN